MSEQARVLVADDEPGIRFVLRETLVEAGHEVVEAASGDEALAALASGEFAIAFFDIRMPGPSGLELLDQVKASGSDGSCLPVSIALTAWRDTPIRPPSSAWLQPRSARSTRNRFRIKPPLCQIMLTLSACPD